MHREFPPLTAGELDSLRRIVAAQRAHRGYDRFYNIHIRKTGGTSVNYMFYALCGEDSADVDRRLHEAEKRVVVCGGMVYTWGNQQVIESGHYFYGASHIPAHQLRLPPRTFTIVTLRDPLQRLISHYRMVLADSRKSAGREHRQIEESWLGSGSFGEFIGNMPREYLCGQVYTFSSRMDAAEAADRICTCSHVFFVEEFAAGAAELAAKTALPLAPVHVRNRDTDVPIDANDADRARAMLAVEYAMIEQIGSVV
jgi:hypothetical protein